MNDEQKLCGNCGHEHAWGVVSYSDDNVRLYGARMCVAVVGDVRCGCRDWSPASEGTELAVVMPPEELQALWAETSFLSAQTPMATRIAVRQINALEGKEREKEFMGLMISQVTDIRAAMTKDESKFAHLVSHADEIVESMRGVVQLSERLEGVKRGIESTNERMDRFESLLGAIAEKFGVQVATEQEAARITEVTRLHNKGFEHAREMFTKANSSMQNEAVVVDGKLVSEPD